jgi:hypothetical protein
LEIFEICPRVPKLQIWLLRGWGRCLKVTLQTCAPEISAHVDRGTSGPSSVRRRGARTPIGVSGNLFKLTMQNFYLSNGLQVLNNYGAGNWIHKVSKIPLHNILGLVRVTFFLDLELWVLFHFIKLGRTKGRKTHFLEQELRTRMKRKTELFLN